MFTGAAEACLTISIGYLLNSIKMIYSQHLTHGLQEPRVNLLYPGALLFAVGATFNYYHHYMLSRLRDGAKGYKIPWGGLFDIVTCPHYLFEMTVFLGVAMVAKTV